MNKLEWNLQEIFTDNQSFYDEIDNIKQLLEDVKNYENIELNSTLILNLLDKKWKIKEKSNNEITVAAIACISGSGLSEDGGAGRYRRGWDGFFLYIYHGNRF